MPVWSYLGICWKNLQDTWERLPMSLPGAGEIFMVMTSEVAEVSSPFGASFESQ